MDIKVKRAALESGGRTIAEQFGTEFPLQLGRLDTTEPDAPSSLPPFDAPVADITVLRVAVSHCQHHLHRRSCRSWGQSPATAPHC